MRGPMGRDRLGAMRIRTGWLAGGCVGLASAVAAQATVRPDLPWQALVAPHVRVVFEPGLEALARRVVPVAESAYVALARELVPPRGRIDLVLADNADYANGAATPFPSNRIVLYARPPIDQLALRPHADWMRLLVTHEMAHVFHLDRARGLWAVGQRVFGRAAPLFPNAYTPSWILEGVAVHYESRLGDGGRLRGSDFPAVARAAALDGRLPTLDALSLGAPRFPSAAGAYVYGAFAMTRGDTTPMRRFIEESSRRLFVSRLDAKARAAFGMSFQARWAAWRDSVTRAASAVPAPDGAVALRSREGFIARHPRFVDDSLIRYAADDGRRVPGFYETVASGPAHRLGRRNSVDVSALAADGASIAAELEFTDPYTIRSDLYREPDGRGRRVRWGVGQRLAQPDLHRASGRLVAVQTRPGTTDLVILQGPDALPRRLVAGSLDTTWAEPRWSRDGTRVAAVRWTRGGRLAVVVLDSAGTVTATFAPPARVPGWITVVSAPAWEPGDTTLVFSSDHEGRAMLYRGDVRTGAIGRLWETRTALQSPDVSPSGARLAAVELRGDGFHVVSRATPGAVAMTAEPPAPPASMPAATIDSTAPALPYAAAGELVPTWWLPVAGPSGPGSWSLGFMTSARDLVGRHAYALSWARDLSRPEVTTSLSYQYAGFGNPVIGVTYAGQWQHFPVRQPGGAFAGWLGERTRRGGVQVTRQRAGVRWAGWVAVGGELEAIDYQTDPEVLRSRLTSDRFRRTTWSQAAQLSAGVSTMQRPSLAVSVEDGVAATTLLARRFGGAVDGGDVDEAVGVASAAVAVPWPGFARAVLAGRVAAGWTASEAASGFSVGGVSGTSLQLLPGVVIGGSPRTFGVRGFAAGSLAGTRAVTTSAEVRLPLALIGRGVRGTSVFFQKTALTAFTDAGVAWCDRAVPGSPVCPDPAESRRWLGTIGGELGVDAALQYDLVYRFRFGAAHPVRGLGAAPSRVVFYFSMGSTF